MTPGTGGRALRVGLELLAVLLVYAVAAAVLTWPMALHAGDIIVGGGELGGWLWRYWWHFLEIEAMGQADLGLLQRWLEVLAIGRHPETGNVLDVILLSWPLSRLLDFPLDYNVKVLGILVLDGVAGYTLARRFVRGRLVALVAGLAAIFNPLVIQELNGSGLRQCVLWWLLLYPVALDRVARRPSLGGAFLAGACLAAAAAWYWFHGLFALLFTVMYLAWHLGFRQVAWRGLLRWLLPLGATAALLSLPFVLPYMDRSEASGAQLPEMSFFLPFPRYETIAEAPLRPMTYEENVLASLHRTIRSSWSADWILPHLGDRGLPGVVLLFGVIPVLLRGRQRFWLLVLLAFYLLSLGPFLKPSAEGDAGGVLVLGGEWVVRLPYTWAFRWLPGMSRLFAPYRYAAMAVVASVVILAVGLGTIRSGHRFSLLRGLAALSAAAGMVLQSWFLFHTDYVAEGSFAPNRWRPPVKVSRVGVPAFYEGLDPGRLEGLIELPVNREQDVLAWYQARHHHRVHGSWATTGAVPPVLMEEGGGDAGARIRFLARPVPADARATALLEEMSRDPASVPVEEFSRAALGSLIRSGAHRWLVVHERGYYLVDPRQGHLLYRDAVRRISAGLELEPAESIEHRWEDYPGNRYTVPDGPVYVPWSAEEINLPDQEMPRQLHMAVFDLGPILDAPAAEGAPDATAGDHSAAPEAAPPAGEDPAAAAEAGAPPRG